MITLDDEEIQIAKAEAYRLSWTHKAHPRSEKEKYLLKAQLKKVAGRLETAYDNAPIGRKLGTLERFMIDLKREVED